MSDKEHINAVVRSLPGNPGVYRFLDKNNKVIYVGKAKNLKKRVSSYFTKEHESGKIRVMVKKIADISFVVVNTELDALLLENNLIKKYQPRYNVMLKDDKSFPWICIKKEPFPRVFSLRNPNRRDGSEYYGPYASVKMMNTVLDLVRQLYPLRTCNLKLSKKNIENGKFKVCLEYHIGNCKGPCEGHQTEEDYKETIDAIRQIIKGNINTVARKLKELMMENAENYEFERAQTIKEKLELLERFQSKSTIVNPKIHNVDVYSIISDVESGYVNYLKVVNGAVVQAHTIEMKKRLDENEPDLLAMAIADFRQRFDSDSKEIIVPIEMDFELEGLTTTIPQRGDKKQLLDLSTRNAKYYKLEKDKQQSLVDPERHTTRMLKTMQKDLRLKEPPRHIECFDNSNIQGTNPVAAMVVFRNAKPAKKEYRHYNIKTVTGPDDYASMREVVYRRYKRLLEEEKDLPQLIVIDGGKGQLSAALKSLEELGLRGKISIIGIAKKLEEIYFPGDPVPLYIDKTSETLKVIQHLRDEAHRFGITHHRKRREKELVRTELTGIKGIGESTAQKLLREFKSVKGVRKAEKEKLEAVVGRARAEVIQTHFANQS
ncbi:MAG: excinuclease ABC subunit UvrC [Bacteroidales bacterium]|nr:excinuclease ABC subunit UvrC [Bacteroidales bacterium]MCF8344401.1 excinuclease ABC subunit UvrC [Bacteroidales bacterium]MCF8352484.1 excinuclease ABC subunit UvrC [Bacteroidales bacterium]MCF8376387.1 excinuclease ABC subunit UvrC [Bacteroidales bacterium]MCF8401229.1 excinuclease ABC subunit UvrC [Bacteroidales bacterium]